MGSTNSPWGKHINGYNDSDFPHKLDRPVTGRETQHQKLWCNIIQESPNSQMKDLYTWACCSGASVFSMYPVLIYTLQYLASRISCVDFLVQFLDISILVSWPIEDQLSHSLVDPSTGGDSFGVNPLPPLVIQSVSNNLHPKIGFIG